MGKRRRRTHSYWLDTLQEIQEAKRLQEESRLSQPSAIAEGVATTSRDENNDQRHHQDSDLRRSTHSDTRAATDNGRCNDNEPTAGATVSHPGAQELRDPELDTENENSNAIDRHGRTAPSDNFQPFDINDGQCNGTERTPVAAIPHGGAQELSDPERDTENGKADAIDIHERTAPSDNFQAFDVNEQHYTTNAIPSELIRSASDNEGDSEAGQNGTPYHGEDEGNQILRDQATRSGSSANPEQGHKTDPDMDALCHNLRMRRGHLTLTAVLAVVGSVRYTVDLYEHTRDLIQETSSGVTWPPYSRTQQYFKNIIDSVLPRSKLVRLPKKISTTIPGEYDLLYHELQSSQPQGETPALETETAATPRLELSATGEVRVFFPSSWAKLDVSSPVVFENMFPSFPSEQHKARPLDDAPITQDGESVTSPCDSISVEFQRKLVRCRPRDTVNVHLTSIAPTFANSFQIINSGNRYSFDACVMATWTVGADSISNPSFERAVNLDTLTSQEKCIMSGLSTASRPNLISNLQYTGVIPGDTCTLLRSEEGESDACPVIVHRYWRHEDGIPSILVLWIQTSSPQIQPHGADSPAQILDTHIVEKVRLRRPCISIPATSRHDKARRSCYGRLADGTPYVVYRILLYCDDFQKSWQMGKGSAGGCYFLPLSLPAEKRRNTSSVRIISLTPPGVSTNEVLHFIVPDLVHSSLHGVEGHTPSGVKLRIFLDVLGFTGDYPASASVIDEIRHTGSAPCTLCSFRRPQEAETEGSRYGYTTAVHARNNAFLRHGQIHTSMRISGVSDADCNRIGLVQTDRAGDRECPLLYLQQQLEINRSSAALAHDGNLATGGHFDAYRCNFVAADHLLTGLIKDMLNATFGYCRPHSCAQRQIFVYAQLCAATASSRKGKYTT